MNPKKRQRIYLFLIMVGVAFAVSVVSLDILYQTAFEQQKARLVEVAQSQARLIEAVARFNAQYSSNYPGGAAKATLSQISEARENFKGFGETGEFTLAKREGDQIIFILRHRHLHLVKPEPVLFNSGLAEPMVKALNGESGIIVGLDYRGEKVLAAHEPVNVLNLGIVAKIDISEIKEPFIKAGKTAIAIGFLIILVGTFLFMRISKSLFEGLRKAGEALKENEEKYRELFNSELDAILVIDQATFQVIDVNKSALNLYGYSKEEFLKLKVFDISAEPEETRNTVACAALGETGHVPLRMHKKKDGTQMPVELTTGKFKLKNRSIVFGVYRDITVRMEAEERLKVAQKQLIASQKLAGIGELAAGVSHEVLNPVNIVSIHTQMLQRKRPDDAELQTFCAKVENELKRIEKILSSLLAFSRKGDSEIVKVSIESELDSVLNLIEKDFSLDNIEIVHKCGAEQLEVEIDKDKIRQVFLNIVNNAKHAMPDGGVLTVVCGKVKKGRSEYLEMRFLDTGHGIKKEHVDRIFDPFFTTKGEGEGTGMGLSVCHAIIEKHGGTIIVESQEGKGSAFIIILPLV